MKDTIRQIKKHRIASLIRSKFPYNKHFSSLVCGLTEIGYLPKDDFINIEHAGNMGNSIESSINPNLKRLGIPTIEELKTIYETKESGSPDYYYSCGVWLNKIKS